MKLFTNARIPDGKETKLVNILFDQKIIKISVNEIREKNADTIDLEGKLLIPGCIDAHVHFNDPGYTHHEDFLTGTTAAAYGGITTVIDMPCTSLPPVTNVENLQAKLNVIDKKALTDFALWGGIRKEDVPLKEKQVLQLWERGVVGFKIYTISGMKEFSTLSYEEIQNVFRKFPKILFGFHAEDKTIIQKALKSGIDFSKPENNVKERPVKAELKAVQKIIFSMQENNPVHFVHISCKESAQQILKNKKRFDITFETCPHFLQFTSKDMAILKGRLKTAPPVKYEQDKQFLRKCLKTDKLDFVTTDHAGCDWESEKNLKDFSKVYNGIPGTQFIVPYLFSGFYLNEKVDLSRMIQLTSENAAKRFGLYPQKGSLQIGTDADFTIIDLNKPYIVNENKLHSKGKYSPFYNTVFSCSVNKTIIRGKTVFDSEKGILQKPGFGKFIQRK